MCGEGEEGLELRKDYLQGKPPSQIKVLTRADFGKSPINPAALLKLTIHDNRHPPPIQYRIAFAKYVIKQLETRTKQSSEVQDDDECEDNENISLWYDALESLSSSATHSEPFYRLYDIFGDENDIIKVFENESAFVAEGTTGLVTWEASTYLAEWLISTKCELENIVSGVKWCVELGCGCGFLAIATMKILPNLNRYVVTDGHHSALSKCRENILANYDDMPTNVDLEIIDWDTDGKKFQGIIENLSLNHGTGFLFGADIVFDPSLIPPLVKMMILFLETQTKNEKKGQVVLSCTVRNASTVSLLKEEIGKHPNVSLQNIFSWKNGVVLNLYTTSNI